MPRLETWLEYAQVNLAHVPQFRAFPVTDGLWDVRVAVKAAPLAAILFAW